MSEDKNLQTITAHDLLLKDIPPIDWFYENLLSNPSLIALSGSPGSYKTYFALWIASRLSASPPRALFSVYNEPSTFGQDTPTEPVPTLFVEEEMSERQIKKRATQFDADTDYLHFAISHGLKLTDDDHVDQLQRFCITNRIRFIIFDPFSSATGLKDENDNAEVAKVMDIMRSAFITEPSIEATVMFLHHPSKGDKSARNLRGASDILGKCDLHLSLDKNAVLSKILVSYEKCRDIDTNTVDDFFIELSKGAPMSAQELQFTFDRFNPKDYRDDREKVTDLKPQVLNALMAMMGGTKTQVAEKIGTYRTNKNFVEAFKELQAEKKIVLENKKYYVKDII